MKKYLILTCALLASFVGNSVQAETLVVSPCSHGQYVAVADEAAVCYVPELFCNDRSYVKGFLGTNYLHSHKKAAAKMKFHTGLMAAVALGYQFDAFRGELEFAYRHNELRSIDINQTLVRLKGHVASYALMANAYYDFSFDTWFTPYVGAGVGFTNAHAHYTTKDLYDLGQRKQLSERTENFTYQGIIGAKTNVYAHTDISVEYRILEGNKHLKQHSLVFGAQYHF